MALGHVRRANRSDDARNMGNVVVNPKKSDMLTYEPGDRIIVLAQD